jgi:hypothetical protein
MVYMPSPHSRYDHNRTRPLTVATFFEEGSAPLPGGAAVTPREPLFVRFRKADYAPQAKDLSRVDHPSAGSSADGLPPAQLVPTFTGLPLPLSDDSIAGCAPGRCRSDRDDLIDFLASGVAAQAGVEQAAAQGDTITTAAHYRPLLDLLARGDALASGAGLEQALEPLDVVWAEGVLDARYTPAAFAGVAAFKYRDFWFVLYKFPRKPPAAPTGYSRLVVVPTELRQDICHKRPTSPSGCP